MHLYSEKVSRLDKVVVAAPHLELVCRFEKHLHLTNVRANILLPEVLHAHKAKFLPRLALNPPPDLDIDVDVAKAAWSTVREFIFDLSHRNVPEVSSVQEGVL